MRPSTSLVTLGLIVSPLAVNAGPVQSPRVRLPFDAAQQRAAVQQIFLTSYEAYKTYAWGNDDLTPISKSFANTRNGWGASIVDSLSTMFVMGLDDELEDAIHFASQIDFSRSKTNSTVSIFESTIRYVASLLSTYELTGFKHPQLLAKAKQLGDKLSHGWVNGQAVPFGFLDFSTDTAQHDTSNIAEAGTLSLEFATLSKYTRNATYSNLAVGSAKHVAQLAKPLPGLAAQGIDPKSGKFVGGYVTWGGGSDSYFEYLIKYARLSNTQDPTFVNQWLTAVDSSIKTLAKKSTVGNHLYLADYDSSGTIRHVGSHLACFHGGNWIFGGRLLNNETIVNYGLQLADACWNTYAGTATGIGPEAFGFMSSDGNYTGDGQSAEQATFYNQKGFYIRDGSYDLRPEVLESNFYAWRATGDKKYYNRAVTALQSFLKYLPAGVAYDAREDVNDVHSGTYDHMESFWFAEVLKYLYLTFDDPNRFSLDKYVFNTEAHPFIAPPARRTYGPGVIETPTSGFASDTISGPLPAISPSLQHPNGLNDILGIH
ncbi:glycoside hydrolase family 47 protein [Pluteus cervinus]|uniref:Glycoside hydrolase family 47 protein n=1 Tax=Pluteus cervinus TaxID=181527 RepID=A0ACD3B742_9AGAR|nr:glycoside hydrolase family 47 protein [Pluteus cervinus]